MITYLLLPFSFLFLYLAKKRKHFALVKASRQSLLRCPIVVVGNLNVGGTGKTPICIEIIKLLQKKGYHPALISRGYGRKTKGLRVGVPDNESFIGSKAKLDAFAVGSFGDEPYMITKKCAIPLAVSEKRLEAAKAIMDHFPKTDIIISDDGLQHYALPRDIEIAVIGNYGLGNGLVLPAGPLRESHDRLQTVDFILHHMNDDAEKSVLESSETKFYVERKIQYAYPLKQKDDESSRRSFSFFHQMNTKMTIMAGIAHPEMFFKMLNQQGIFGACKSLPDHYQFSLNDFDEEILYFITEKDAVKCEALCLENVWVVPLFVCLSADFEQAFLDKVQKTYSLF